jgi:hypothetical protein
VKSLTKLRIKTIKSANRFSKTNLTVFALIFAAIGGYVIYSSFAAGFSASFEAENSTKNSPATSVADSNASGGSALKFQAGGSCALPKYPDATCTGVPSGTALTAYTGPTNITTANTVIDSKTVTGCLEIQAANVIIKNSKINCFSGGAGSAYAILLDDGPGWNNWSLTIQDSEIDCGGDPPGGFNNSTALGSAFITVRRANIHGCENGFDVNQVMDIQDSYIHDLRQCTLAEGCSAPDGSHTDGLQMSGGHFSPAGTSTIVSGVLNLTITHNTILSMKAGASANGNAAGNYFTTSAIISNSGSKDRNVIIDDNLLGGGAYTIYCEQGAGSTYQGTSEVKRNHFTTRFKSSVGAFGPSSDCNNENIAGNVYDETGLPVPMD